MRGKGGNGWGEPPVGMSKSECANVCGRCGWKGKDGNGWGEGPVGMSGHECADVCGRGRVRTVWLQGKRWKWWVEGPESMSECGVEMGWEKDRWE